jgi:hypothetical protein
MLDSRRATASCALAILVALYVVGAVSIPPGSLPLFLFWLAIMIAIWLFLLGWARIVSGHFFPAEIAMTIVIGVACAGGLAVSTRWRTGTRALTAGFLTVLFGGLQLLSFRLSLIPYIAGR